MKVVLVNGSRRKNGCTYTALCEMAEVFKQNGIESEIFFVGEKAVSGEIDDIVRQVANAMKDADGIVVGAPVYYASPSGEVVAFMDRLAGVARNDLMFKPAAAITSARRAGTTATIDVLNKYFMFNQMPIVSSHYWNMVHGNTPEEVRQDKEGMQIMRFLANNMSWLIKCIDSAKKQGINIPKQEEIVRTNFIR